MRMHALLGLALVLGGPAGFAGGDEPKGGKHGGSAPRAAKDEAKDWSKHTGDIPFIIGREAGMKEVEFTGKPILFFYTATW